MDNGLLKEEKDRLWNKILLFVCLVYSREGRTIYPTLRRVELKLKQSRKRRIQGLCLEKRKGKRKESDAHSLE